MLTLVLSQTDGESARSTEMATSHKSHAKDIGEGSKQLYEIAILCAALPHFRICAICKRNLIHLLIQKVLSDLGTHFREILLLKSISYSHSRGAGSRT